MKEQHGRALHEGIGAQGLFSLVPGPPVLEPILDLSESEVEPGGQLEARLPAHVATPLLVVSLQHASVVWPGKGPRARFGDWGTEEAVDVPSTRTSSAKATLLGG